VREQRRGSVPRPYPAASPYDGGTGNPASLRPPPSPRSLCAFSGGQRHQYPISKPTQTCDCGLFRFPPLWVYRIPSPSLLTSEVLISVPQSALAVDGSGSHRAKPPKVPSAALLLKYRIFEPSAPPPSHPRDTIFHSRLPSASLHLSFPCPSVSGPLVVGTFPLTVSSCAANPFL